MPDETVPTSRKRVADPASSKSRKPAAKSISAKANQMNQTTTPSTIPGIDSADTGTTTGTATGAASHRSEAKTRFNAAVTEAKAGAAALKSEAAERAGVYREQAAARGKDWASEARAYGDDAKVKGKDLAAQGKGKVSEGLTALGQAVADSAQTVDEKLGAKYGDYARTASRSLQDAATRLDAKSVEDLGEDAREFVRKSPGTAVGIAAVVGFLLSRLFRR